MSSKLPVVYTIGHSTHSLAQFVEILQSHGIDTVLDVRRFPGSRKHPHFGKDSLQKSLSKKNITYHHMVHLGGRRNAIKDGPHVGRKRKRSDCHSDSEENAEMKHMVSVDNSGWRNKSFKYYADYAATSVEFWSSICEIVDKWVLKDKRTCCVMCSEGLWWRCHRRIIADYLMSTGQVHVVCIYPSTDIQSDKDARKTEFAVRVDKHGDNVNNPLVHRIVLAYPKMKHKTKEPG